LKQSYRPSADRRDRVSSRVCVHTQQDDTIDPVTFEVIRQKLWTTNIAHGDTITRISGSPVLATLDFNMSILTEDAEVVLNAPYVQFLNAGAPLGIRYILERHSDRPGIDEGDIFCCNDPWTGACHQMDVLLLRLWRKRNVRRFDDCGAGHRHTVRARSGSLSGRDIRVPPVLLSGVLRQDCHRGGADRRTDLFGNAAWLGCARRQRGT
jgi:hypothetical protein